MTEAALIKTASTQIEVAITTVERDEREGYGRVGGWKSNLLLGSGAPFNVFFRGGEPVPVDGANRKHPKLVLAAARAAWGNC